MFGAEKGEARGLDGKGLYIGIVQARFNESITDALAAACLADESSLFSSWIEVHSPNLLPLVERWRAAHRGDAARLRYALGAGVPVGPGEIRSPRDVVLGPHGVVAALWDGSDEVRAEVDVYLATYHHYPLVRFAFDWLNDGAHWHYQGDFEASSPGTASWTKLPHLFDLTAYVVHHSAALVEQLSWSPVDITWSPPRKTPASFIDGTVWKDVNTWHRIRNLFAESSDLRQRDRSGVLLTEVVPVIFGSTVLMLDEGMIDPIVRTATALLKFPEDADPLRLKRLAAWLHTAAQALAHAEAQGEEAWRYLVERMDDILLTTYRRGMEELGSDRVRLPAAMELLRESIESLAEQGVRLTLIERIRSEEAAYSKLAHVVRGRTDALRGSALAAADAKAAAAAEEKRSEAARREDVSDARGQVRWSWLEIAFLLLAGVLFLYSATDLWDLLAGAIWNERRLGSGATGVGAVLEVLAASTRGMRWALFKTYLPLVEMKVVRISSLSGGVVLTNADNGRTGKDAANAALFDYSRQIGSDEAFTGQEETGQRTLNFSNPAQEQFTFDAAVTAYQGSGGSSGNITAPSENPGTQPSSGSGGITGLLTSGKAVLRFTYNPLTKSVLVQLVALK